VLLRRLVRSQCRLPSRMCTSYAGRALVPDMPGLHLRFRELYATDHAADGSPDPEALVEGMQRRATMEDGQQIAYWDVGPRDADSVVILCNGLGARVAGWVAVFDALHAESSAWSRRRVVIPEYRGQFASVPLVGDCKSLSVERSAADIAALADMLGVKRASLLCWSTGVQAGLQLALDRPELVEAMVLIQGTCGQALNYILQVPFTIPGMPSLLGCTLSALPPLLAGEARRGLLRGMMVRHTRLLERLARCTLWFFGSDVVFSTGIRYGQDMLLSDDHFACWCGYAMALDRHKPYDRLHSLKQPALIITGTPDFITPARCSYDMAAQLGGEVEFFDDVGGSHYYIFEEPHKVARLTARFLDRAAPVGKG